MSNLKEIPALVAVNRIETALQVLTDTAVQHTEFLNDALHLQNRWVDLKARRNRGELSFDEENRQHAKIVAALLDLTERMKMPAAGLAVRQLPRSGQRPWKNPVALFLTGAALLLFLFFYDKIRHPGTFEFTVRLKPKPGIELSPTYPPITDAKLILQLANESKPAGVNSLDKYEAEADFKNIAADYRGQWVVAKLVDDADLNRPVYWRPAPDSVLLDGKNQTLWIVPDGSLGFIRGSVQDAHDAQPLSGVILGTQGIFDTSDSHGRFKLHIPPNLQESEYKVTARKIGYEITTRNVRPASVPELPVLMPRTNEQ